MIKYNVNGVVIPLVESERVNAMEGRERKKYELSTVQRVNGMRYLLFVQGGSSIPELAPINGCIVGDGTTKGVIEAFEKIVMSSEWEKLDTMQVIHKLLHYLAIRRFKIDLFVFIQDYELFTKGRHELCISFMADEYSPAYIKNLVRRELMRLNVAEEDIKIYQD